MGGILGGVLTGRPGGAAVGAIVGGTTGAVIGAQAEQRHDIICGRASAITDTRPANTPLSIPATATERRRLRRRARPRQLM